MKDSTLTRRGGRSVGHRHTPKANCRFLVVRRGGLLGMTTSSPTHRETSFDAASTRARCERREAGAEGAAHGQHIFGPGLKMLEFSESGSKLTSLGGRDVEGDGAIRRRGASLPRRRSSFFLRRALHGGAKLQKEPIGFQR